MLIEVALQGERLIASRALKVFEAGVRLHVGTQIGTVGERFSAMSTSEWLLSRVGSHVALEKPWPRERLTADLAFVLQVMGEDVHRQRRHRNVYLITCRALLGQLRVGTSMGLLVSRQIRRRGIVLSTF